jgi:hypothetical protein
MSRLKFEIIPLPDRKKLEKYRGLIVDEDLPVLVSGKNRCHTSIRD